MPIQMTLRTDVLEYELDPLTPNALQCQALVDNRDISHHSLQSVAQCVRGSRDIVEQAEFSKVARLREMEAEQIILSRERDEIQKLNLLLDVESCAAVFDLYFDQARLPHQGFQVDPRLASPRIGKPGDSSHRGRERAEGFGTGFAHNISARNANEGGLCQQRLGR
jgi:hypothetical protein